MIKCSVIISNDKATGGFAGPGNVELDGVKKFSTHRITLYEEDASVLEVTGTFERDDGNASLPSSTALFVYLELDDDSFIRGEGIIDPSTGEFAAKVTGVPDGLSKAFYSFVVVDPEEAVVTDDGNAESVFESDVVSITCPSPLTIALEWNTGNSSFDMEIFEPDGSCWYAEDVGVSFRLASRARFGAAGTTNNNVLDNADRKRYLSIDMFFIAFFLCIRWGKILHIHSPMAQKPWASKAWLGYCGCFVDDVHITASL